MKKIENSYMLGNRVKQGNTYVPRTPELTAKLSEALEVESMMHSKVDNKEQFYMPGGKVVLQLRTVGDPKYTHTLFLDVIRTSRSEPKYVQEIVKRFDGSFSGSYQKPVNPMDSIDLLVK